jgi:predicted dehydrogenase
MKNIGFGIVGCGFFGAEFARILHKLEGATVAAVYGGSGGSIAALAMEVGCRVEHRLEDLVSRKDVDAIIVSSPNYAHKEAVLEAARCGKHVFCEKPAALSLSDCKEMLDACRKAGVHMMVGHILHFFPGIEQVKRWIQQGEIGQLVVAHSERTGWEKSKEEVSWKKKQDLSGGHLFHHIHELDLVLSILGPAVKVSMMADNVAHRGDGYGDEDDVLLISLQFATGTFCTLQYGSGFQWGEHYMKINGTLGAIKIDFRNSTVELRKDGRTEAIIGLHGADHEDQERIQTYQRMDGGVIYGDPQMRPPAFLRTPMEREMDTFRKAILHLPIDEDKKLLLDGSAAYTSIAVAEAALLSSREQTILSLSLSNNNVI